MYLSKGSENLSRYLRDLYDTVKEIPGNSKTVVITLEFSSRPSDVN